MLLSPDVETTGGEAVGRSQPGQGTKGLKAIRLLRLGKMLRLRRLRNVMKTLDSVYPGLWTSSKLLVIILVIMFLSHIVACGWYQIGHLDQLVRTAAGDYSINVPGWVSGQFLPTYGCGNTGCGAGTAGGGGGGGGGGSDGISIINTTNGFATEELFSWEHAYIDAYYYAITTLTTVGYGDRTPNTDPEKVYSIMAELAGGIVFGVLASMLGGMLSSAKCE
eukprot:SAG22_NODE_1141_length_5388_cov_2.279259_3_plen_221_part_00